jgi:gas vesicle protein
MNLSEELQNIHSHMFTSSGLPIPSNDIPTISENITDIIQQQIRQLKQSFDNIKQKDQSSINNLSNDSKELQDQVSFVIYFCKIFKIIYYR